MDFSCPEISAGAVNGRPAASWRVYVNKGATNTQIYNCSKDDSDFRSQRACGRVPQERYNIEHNIDCRAATWEEIVKRGMQRKKKVFTDGSTLTSHPNQTGPCYWQTSEALDRRQMQEETDGWRSQKPGVGGVAPSPWPELSFQAKTGSQE